MPALVGAFGSYSAYWNYVTLSLERDEHPAPWRDHYKMLRAYYLQNGLYEVVAKLLQEAGVSQERAREVRNPAFRVVEFYAAKLWPGDLPDALPIEPDEKANPEIVAAIEQVWDWSNWGAEKQTAARWFATYGDMFIKVATKTDDTGRVNRVFMQNIEPIFVSDMDTDERGYITYVRIDIPRTRRVSDKTKPYIHTEVWTKQVYRLWEHDKPVDTEIEKLGTPTRTVALAAMGIDFVPIVWMPFRAIGDERGTGAFTLQVGKIDEANRQATRLHQMLFRYNRALWALQSNMVDSAGRPMPAPRVGSETDGVEGTLEVSDNTIIRLPGMSDLKSLVAPIDYSAALEVLSAQLDELKADLPELAYYAIREMGDPSGVAIRLLLSDAIDRLIEARGNAETALIRAHQMALTLGAFAGLPAFQGLGTYTDGSFKHTFAERDPFPLSKREKAETAELLTKAGFPPIAAARMAGFSEEEIEKLEEEIKAEAERTATMASAALNAAQTRFDREDPESGTIEGE